jgi:hypothetical protein
MKNVVEHAFHCARRMRNRAAQVCGRSCRKVANRFAYPVSGCRPVSGRQLGFGSKHGVFEGIVPTDDGLSIDQPDNYTDIGILV